MGLIQQRAEIIIGGLAERLSGCGIKMRSAPCAENFSVTYGDIRGNIGTCWALNIA